MAHAPTPKHCIHSWTNQAARLVHLGEPYLERHVLDPHKRALWGTHYQFLVIVYGLWQSIAVHPPLFQGRNLGLFAFLLIGRLHLLADRTSLVDAWGYKRKSWTD